jgi:two-component system response regulator NreC
MSKLKVFVCDDHTLFREGIKSILGKAPEIEIVGEARNGREAVEKVLRLRPDVVLMDVGLPDLSGLQATRRIKHAQKHIHVLMLSMYDEEEIIAGCLDAGASGYLVKDAALPQLLHAIEAVRKGGTYLGSGSLKKVLNQHRKTATDSYERLSDREREVLQLLAEGFSVKEIASRLNLSVKTVDAHKYNLMRKLEIHSQAELIKYAIRKKLIVFPVLQ